MKLEGWRIKNEVDGSVVILLVSKHYHKENVLSRYIEHVEQPSPDEDDLDIGNISIDIPDVAKGVKE